MKRYALHTSPVGDAGYLKYLEPMLSLVREHIETLPEGSPIRLLDFGSGPQSVIQREFAAPHLEVFAYDPHFKPRETVLFPRAYQLIVLSEVIEHFKNPLQELQKLCSYLQPNGAFCISTQLCDDSRDFENWGYRRDPTHIGFFAQKTFQVIQQQLGFSELKVRLPTGIRLLL